MIRYMEKAKIIACCIILMVIAGMYFAWHSVASIFALPETEDASAGQQEQRIQTIIETRREQHLQSDDTDPFGNNDIVKVLFIGLDNRIGETNGHCDAIQLIEINKAKQEITITAVPRGTYAPLPGSGHKPTDYYVSKSCEVGGLDYGIQQIERILGIQSDFLVVMGFSQAMGIFRQLELPEVETMQWLRLRQGYAIGEPQRARNHSNFIKQLLIEYAPLMHSKTSVPIAYVTYNFLRTDLTFNQAMQLAEAIANLNLEEHPERIQLRMRPAYAVKDIGYDPEQLNEYIQSMIQPIAYAIPEGAYNGDTQKASQETLLSNINEGLEDDAFVKWAYDNYIWLQITNDEDRKRYHFEIMRAYADSQQDEKRRTEVIADYIIEMENVGNEDRAKKGKDLLTNNLTDS